MKAVLEEIRSLFFSSTRVVPATGPVLAAVALAPGVVVLLGPFGPPGITLTLCSWAVVLPGVLGIIRTGREQSRAHPVGRVRAALIVILACLFAVFTLRDSSWLLIMCGAAGTGLSAIVLVDARSLARALVALPLLGDAVLRAPAWSAPALPSLPAGRVLRPWIRGLVVGGVLAAAIGGLLASADVLFARLLVDAVPSSGLGGLAGRLVAGTVAGLLALGGACAAGLVTRTRTRAAEGPARHPAEWLLPVGLIALLLAAFMAVQVTALFGAAGAVLDQAGVTPAERARQGFGQLAVVTVLVTVLLGWAAGCASAGDTGGPGDDPARRRLFGIAGGITLLLTALLAVSALRRLWLYESESGWTVRRVSAGAFEVWVVLVLLGLAVLWRWRREDLAVRMVAGSAGLGLLCVALAGPDALVARADVTRFERTGAIDAAYLSGLSSGAVPAVDGLPEPVRSCVLGGIAAQHLPGDLDGEDGGWLHWNLDRHRARALLRDSVVRPPSTMTGC